VAASQVIPANFHGSGAFRNSMKCAITNQTLIAAITMTATVPTAGATMPVENHQVDAAVASISANQMPVTGLSTKLNVGSPQ
jgi:hypothetical protein